MRNIRKIYHCRVNWGNMAHGVTLSGGSIAVYPNNCGSFYAGTCFRDGRFTGIYFPG